MDCAWIGANRILDGSRAGSGFVVDWYWMLVDGSGLRKKYRKAEIFSPYKTCGYAWIDLWICLDMHGW